MQTESMHEIARGYYMNLKELLCIPRVGFAITHIVLRKPGGTQVECFNAKVLTSIT